MGSQVLQHNYFYYKHIKFFLLTIRNCFSWSHFDIQRSSAYLHPLLTVHNRCPLDFERISNLAYVYCIGIWLFSQYVWSRLWSVLEGVSTKVNVSAKLFDCEQSSHLQMGFYTLEICVFVLVKNMKSIHVDSI